MGATKKYFMEIQEKDYVKLLDEYFGIKPKESRELVNGNILLERAVKVLRKQGFTWNQIEVKAHKIFHES